MGKVINLLLTFYLKGVYNSHCWLFIHRFRVYDVDTKFKNSREEVIVVFLFAFSFDLMFSFIECQYSFWCVYISICILSLYMWI